MIRDELDDQDPDAALGCLLGLVVGTLLWVVAFLLVRALWRWLR